MDDLTNQQIIEHLYRNFAEGNMQAVLSYFDKDIVWVRPGDPEIPFAGTFKRYDGLGKMFSLVTQHIRLKAFIPGIFCSNDNTVIVSGTDTAEVITTGKIYTSDWVQAFTLKDKKIIFVQAYIDTLTIARAFQL